LTPIRTEDAFFTEAHRLKTAPGTDPDQPTEVIDPQPDGTHTVTEVPPAKDEDEPETDQGTEQPSATLGNERQPEREDEPESDEADLAIDGDEIDANTEDGRARWSPRCLGA
jgi:hypothetical protein